jgi:predicted amidohydrolase
VVASLGNAPGVLVTPLDLATLYELRQRMPVQQHQRLRIEGPYDTN